MQLCCANKETLYSYTYTIIKRFIFLWFFNILEFAVNMHDQENVEIAYFLAYIRLPSMNMET